jgi:hypothetical protein
MRNVRFILMTCATLCAGFALTRTTHAQPAQENAAAVSFFDVLDLPVRIDEPKLLNVEDKYRLKCAVANRSGEQLLGLRLILMVVDDGGKLRTRLNWSEESELAGYSIKTFEFRLRLKEKAQETDRLFLAIDEVIGRESIWRAVDAEKALRAYVRGQHDIVPRVRVVANKDDRIGNFGVIRLEKKH